MSSEWSLSVPPHLQTASEFGLSHWGPQSPHASWTLCIRVEYSGCLCALPGLLSLQLFILFFLAWGVLVSKWTASVPWVVLGSARPPGSPGEAQEVYLKFYSNAPVSVCQFHCGPANDLSLLLAEGCTDSGSPQPQCSSATNACPELDPAWADRLCLAELSLLVLRPGSEHWTCGSEQQCERCCLL